jgi:DNA polymerase III psi subunit
MEANTNGNNDDRSFAIQVFAKCIFRGNEIAAEALLMACMSMAEREVLTSEGGAKTWAPIKTPSNTSLGCASLNLILSSQESCNQTSNRLQQVLAQILPVVGLVTLNRETLGTTVVSPAKDESSGRLVQSPLQLPKGSALIIDESMLIQGRIEARAEETLRALHNLTHSHSVPYRFEGMMNYNFEADYRLVVLSKATTTTTGSKLLPCLLTMKLSEDIVTEDEPEELMSVKDCERIRTYLAHCRCNMDDAEEMMNVPLSKNLLEQAQNYFIEQRADYRRKKDLRKRIETMAVGDSGVQLDPLGNQVEEADFHRWLTIARLQARSRIPTGLPENAESEVWAAALRLDEAMRS